MKDNPFFNTKSPQGKDINQPLYNIEHLKEIQALKDEIKVLKMVADQAIRAAGINKNLMNLLPNSIITNQVSFPSTRAPELYAYLINKKNQNG